MTAVDPNIDRALAARINLYYDLHTSSTGPAPLLIALHGYGANTRQMMREAQMMAPEGFAIASLQGFHQHMKEPREPGGVERLGVEDKTPCPGSFPEANVGRGCLPPGGASEVPMASASSAERRNRMNVPIGCGAGCSFS